MKVRAADERLALALEASLGLQVPDFDELTSAQAESYEDDAAAVAMAARTAEELETEIQIIDRLVSLAERVRDAGVDAKWDALAGLLEPESVGTAIRAYSPDRAAAHLPALEPRGHRHPRR